MVKSYFVYNILLNHFQPRSASLIEADSFEVSVFVITEFLVTT
jgi:hypothetical protein